MKTVENWIKANPKRLDEAIDLKPVAENGRELVNVIQKQKDDIELRINSKLNQLSDEARRFFYRGQWLMDE